MILDIGLGHGIVVFGQYGLAVVRPLRGESTGQGSFVSFGGAKPLVWYPPRCYPH